MIHMDEDVGKKFIGEPAHGCDEGALDRQFGRHLVAERAQARDFGVKLAKLSL